MRKAWRLVAVAVCVCLLLSAAGCFSGQEYAEQNGARIHPGMSMDEVQVQLGDPDLVLRGDPGTDTEWIYRYEGGATAVATVFLILVCVVLIVFLVAAKGGGGNFGGGGGGSDGPPYQIRIRFDPQGRVVDISPPHPVGP